MDTVHIIFLCVLLGNHSAEGLPVGKFTESSG